MIQIARIRSALSLSVGVALVVSLALVPSDQALARKKKHEKEFHLGGTALKSSDPENPANDVVKIRSDVAPFFGAVSRTLKVKIDKLDNQVEVKAYFVAPKTCARQFPRIELAIDTDADGDSDGTAFGYFGPTPTFSGCPTGEWQYEDFTDEELEWDLQEFEGPFFNTWSEVETFFNTRHPRHLVCTGALVDDRSLVAGAAYYDILSLGAATYHRDDDSGRRGLARGCDIKGERDGNRDHDDKDDDDDDDDDEDDDEDD